MIKIKVDIKDLKLDLKKVEKILPVVSYQSINKVGTSIIAEGAKEIKAEFSKLKAKDIKSAVKFVKAKKGRLLGEIFTRYSSRKRLSVFKWFGGRQTKTGVSTTIKRGNKLKLKHHFIATMGSGHMGIFYRKGKERLKIKEVITLSFQQMWGGIQMKRRDALAKSGSVKLTKEIERLLTVRLEKEVNRRR